MEIFILILKIIGILLAVFLLLVGAMLAVPVRYRVNVETAKLKVSGRGVFSWLFHIIDFRIWYREDGICYKLRILGIPIIRSGKKERSSGKGRKKNSHTSRKGTKTSLDKRNESDTEKNPEEQQLTDNNKSRKGKNRKDRKQRKHKKGLFWRIRRFFENLKQRFLDIMAGAVTVKEKIQNIKDLIFDEKNKRSLAKAWRELRYMIRHYSPRRAKGELAFGMEDPSQTGQILGALSLLPFWTRYKINIYPDFQTDRFYVEGHVKMGGHIRLWHFLLSVIRLIKDKDIRLLLEKIRT